MNNISVNIYKRHWLGYAGEWTMKVYESPYGHSMLDELEELHSITDRV